MIKKILCVHQGYELYGSDRTFVSCVEFLRDAYPLAQVEVLIPKHGSLAVELELRGFNVKIGNLWVLRRHYGIIGLFLRMIFLPIYIMRVTRRCLNVDAVYINTGVIVDYLLAARFLPRRCVVHVHEIPDPLLIGVFQGLLRFSRAGVLFNSRATAKSFNLPSTVRQRVVHNGVDVEGVDVRVSGSDAHSMEVGRCEGHRLHVLLIGRINDWKGQDLLVDALALLPADIRKSVRARIVGDVFEGADFRVRLLEQIGRLDISEMVSVEPFQVDPSPLYAWADLVVVPSLKPEPFGMVAIEAMAHGRAVLAARHGGLTEIVVEGETGWFHRPRDVDDLAAVISVVAREQNESIRRGAAGRRRYEEHFTLGAFRESFIAAVGTMLPDLPRG